MIFTTKSLIYTSISGAIGLIFYYLFAEILGMTWLGIAFVLIFAGFGFIVGTFKIPDTNSNELTRKLGGEEIDQAFFKWLRFKKKGNVIYTYLKEEDNEDK